ncbi:hypothetical protein BDD43_2414 [Mucilaginibacter gracilis]|uniref:Pectate lyase-like protein n=1 Tax=Mucilaginibacter gracilis TaxID=423350 RepID=A0A495J1M8_9SPHI|nr:hypothetical protein [Mucilaginibacter gracilis]RKR82238.1 hypothetical protein BDD43_2414 [Mucilaginibacter gracilis]
MKIKKNLSLILLVIFVPLIVRANFNKLERNNNKLPIDTIKTGLENIPFLTSSNQALFITKKSFIWDGSIWELFKGTLKQTDLGYQAIYLPGPSGYYYKRNFTGEVNAKWFGAVGDGKADETESLQAFINYVVSFGANGYIAKGYYKITKTLDVGYSTKQSGKNSSFKIRGDAPGAGVGVGTNGTKIVLEGQAKAILRIKQSAWYFGSYEDFSLDCQNVDGAEYGFLFETIGFSQHMLKGIRCENTKCGYGIISGDLANGEFVTFEKCTAVNVDRFFFMDEKSGQSYNHVFLHCGALIRNNGACFEIGGGNLGYGIHVIDFEASGLTTKTGYTYLINNGVSGEAIFDGGRIETCNTVVSHQCTGSYDQNTPISFNNVQFSGMRSSKLNPFLSSTGGGGAYQYIFTACSFILVNVENNFFETNLSKNSGTTFRFKYCTLSGPNMFSNLPANPSGGMEFSDCNFLKINPGAKTITGAPIKLNKSSILPSIGSLGKRETIGASVWESPGIPSNLLIYPDFGTKFGTNIVAPAPWIHTGQVLNFPLLQGYGGPGAADISSSPNSRVICIAPLSGIYQDIPAINFNTTTPSVYQAVLTATGNASFKISLENSSSGVVYDQFEMAVKSSTSSQPICVSLFASDIKVEGNLRIRIQNITTNENITLQFFSQLISQKPMAAYVNPPAGQTKEFKNYWSANEDMVRIYGRLSIPHKTDITGSAATALPDVESDIYLSENTERIKYYAKGKWWEIPRTSYQQDVPKSLNWDIGDIVYNNDPMANSSIGWICTEAGTPGKWQAIYKFINHAILDAAENSTITLLNNEYNIIAPKNYVSTINLKLPDRPKNNDEITIKFTKPVKNVKIINGNIGYSPDAVSAGAMIKLVFDAATSTWY